MSENKRPWQAAGRDYSQEYWGEYGDWIAWVRGKLPEYLQDQWDDCDGTLQANLYAIMADPLTAAVLSLDEIKTMVNEMFEFNRPYLPQFEHFSV